jgi:hypothetical protein
MTRGHVLFRRPGGPIPASNTLFTTDKLLLVIMIADDGCYSYVEKGSTVEVLDPYGCLVLGLLRNASVCAKSVSGAGRPRPHC